MNASLKNLQKLRISGMLSVDAGKEAERKILENLGLDLPSSISGENELED